MVLYLLPFTLCKSIDDGFEIEALDDDIESESAKVTPYNAEDQSHSRRTSNKNILNTCYSGNLEETIRALGLLDLPGVRLVRVEGELYQKLLKTQKVVELKSSSNGSASDASSEKPVKRSYVDICEEQFAYTYVLAHASGQEAYRVDTVVCQSNECWGNLGVCVLKKQTMVVYLIDKDDNFVSQTIEIGCACECMVSV